MCLPKVLWAAKVESHRACSTQLSCEALSVRQSSWRCPVTKIPGLTEYLMRLLQLIEITLLIQNYRDFNIVQYFWLSSWDWRSPSHFCFLAEGSGVGMCSLMSKAFLLSLYFCREDFSSREIQCMGCMEWWELLHWQVPPTLDLLLCPHVCVRVWVCTTVGAGAALLTIVVSLATSWRCIGLWTTLILSFSHL